MHSLALYRLKQEIHKKNTIVNLFNKNLNLQKYVKKLRYENSELKRQNFLLINPYQHPFYILIDEYISIFQEIDDELSNKYDKIDINDTRYDWNNTRITFTEISDILEEHGINFCFIPFSNDIKNVEYILTKNTLILNAKFNSFLFITINDFNSCLIDGWLKIYYTDMYNKLTLDLISSLFLKYFKVKQTKFGFLIKIDSF